MEHLHGLAARPLSRSYAAAWPMVVRDVQVVVDACAEVGIVIAGPDGATHPQIGPHAAIRFNGDADTGEQQQTLTIPPPAVDQRWPAATVVHYQVDTGGFAYDLAVRCVLLRLRALAEGAVEVTSTGSAGSWGEAVALHRRLFGPLPADLDLLVRLGHSAANRSGDPAGSP